MIEITQDAAVTYRQKPENRRIIERKEAGGRWKYYAEHKTADAAKAALVAITSNEQATPLSTIDRTDLGRYEAAIQRGLEVFFEVGEALTAIRDSKLYRGEYKTFSEYCERRWEFSDRRARLLIDAAEVVGNLKSGSMDPLLPTNERQVRPLTKLEPEQQRAVWQKAVDAAPSGKAPTAAQVKTAVAAVAKPEAEPHIEAEYTVMPDADRIIAMLANPHTTPIQLAALFDEATADQLQAALDLLPEDADTRHDSLYRQMLKRRRLDEAHAAMLTPPKWASASERQVELLARVIAVKGLLREIEQQQPGLQQALDDVAGPLKRLIGMLEGKLR